MNSPPAVATISPMPGIRLLTVQRLPLERRKELLRQLARDYLDLEPENVQLLLSAWAHDSVTGPALKSAWLEYRTRIALADDVAEGRSDYRAVDPELLCQERHAAAIEISWQDAEDALDVLAAGRP